MTAMVNLINTDESNGNDDEFESDIEVSDGNGGNGSDSDWSDENEVDDLYKLPHFFFEMKTDDFDVNALLQFDAPDDISEAESDGAASPEEVYAILDETGEFKRTRGTVQCTQCLHTLNIIGIWCVVHTAHFIIGNLRRTELNLCLILFSLEFKNIFLSCSWKITMKYIDAVK